MSHVCRKLALCIKNKSDQRCNSCIVISGSQSWPKSRHYHCNMFTSAGTSTSSSPHHDNRDNKLGVDNYTSAHLALYTRWRRGRRLCWKYTRKMGDVTNRDGWLSSVVMLRRIDAGWIISGMSRHDRQLTLAI